MQVLERLSKAAAIASIVTIVVLQLIAHPDSTPFLQLLTVAGFAAGWMGGHSPRTVAVWTALLVISPSLLRLAAGREGPVLDLVPLAALTGALIRAVPWSRWQLPPLWSMAAGGWALSLALSWPVIVAREAGFEVSGLFDTSAITSWAILSAPQTIAWIGAVALTQLLALLWLDWAFAETAAAGRPPAAMHGLWGAVTVAGVVAIAQGFIDGSILSTADWAARERATGTMLDANAYGAAAALAGPAGFIAIRAGLVGGGWQAAAVVLGINLLGAWLSESRTTLLIAIGGLAGMAIGLAGAPHERRRPGFRTAAVSAAVAVAAVLVLTASAGPLRRMFELPGGRGLGDMPNARSVITEFLWRRGGYGTVAHQIVREYPVAGIGVGSFHFMVADYYREISQDDGLPFDNAQNWWRHQIAELGLLGGAAPLLLSLLVAWSVLRPAPRTQRSPALDYTLKGLLLGVGVCSLVGVPTQNVVVQLAFLGVVAWLVAPLPVTAPRRAFLQAGWAILTVLAVAYAGSHLLLARGSLSPTARAERFQREYVAGGYPEERDEEGTKFNWTDDDTTLVLPRTEPWLVLRLWADHPDLAQKPVHVTLAAQCGTFFDTTLSGSERLTVGVRVPDSYRAVDLHVAVSRTWSPADRGEPDRRRLGVAVVHGYADETVGRVADRVVELPDCVKAG